MWQKRQDSRGWLHTTQNAWPWWEQTRMLRQTSLSITSHTSVVLECLSLGLGFVSSSWPPWPLSSTIGVIYWALDPPSSRDHSRNTRRDGSSGTTLRLLCMILHSRPPTSPLKSQDNQQTSSLNNSSKLTESWNLASPDNYSLMWWRR